MNEPTFIDAESGYSNRGNDVLSFKNIVLRHLERITRIASQEMREGYWENKQQINGGVVLNSKTYSQSTQDSYINAILNLSDLLLPHYDESIAKFEEEIETELESLEDNDNLKEKKKLKLVRKLYREISKFLCREQYLDVGSLED